MTFLNILQGIFYILIIFVLIRSIRATSGSDAGPTGMGPVNKLNTFKINCFKLYYSIQII